MATVIIDSKYYREQFDDWLAGGKVDYKRETYYWTSRKGCFCWEIEIMEDREWCDLSDKELKNLWLIYMKISYDPEIDALYIRLIEGKYECRTLRLNEEIALNIGPDEKLVGIEIFDAKEVLGSGKLPKLVVENLPLTNV